MSAKVNQQKDKWTFKYIDLLTNAIFIALFFDIPYIRFIFPFAKYGEMAFLLLAFFCAGIIILSVKTSLRSNIIFLGVFLGYMFVNTMVNDISIIGCANQLLFIVDVCLAIYLNKDWMTDGTLRRWIWFLGVVVCLDFISQLLYPHGLYSSAHYDLNWILGYKTNRMQYSLPLIIFVNLRYVYRKRFDGIYFFLVAVVLINMYLSDGSAGLAIMLLFEVAVAFVLVHYHRTKHMPSIGNLAFCYPLFFAVIAGFFGLVVVSKSNDILHFIISFFTDKSITLSGRTNIWASAIAWLKHGNMWTGGGYLELSDYTAILDFNNPHNQILSYLMTGGIVGVGLLMLYIIDSIRNLRHTPENCILLLGIYAVGILGAISSTLSFSPLFFVFFIMTSNSRELEKTKKNRKKKSYKQHQENARAVG